MRRRRFLAAGLSLAGATVLHVPPARTAAALTRVRPGMPGWPTEAEWEGLKEAVDGRWSPVALPDFKDPAVRKLLSDPFYIGDQPGLTQNSGWLDAWRSSPSAYVVAAETAADVAAAIRFARAHNLRLVVKGGSHSFLGTSNAPDSLLVWTRRMNAVTVHDGFTPQGSEAAPVPAVSAGAGCIWLHLYQAVIGGAGRYVQGGGCTTVGVPGLVQGGGFGSYSKAYGTAAASLLEAEIVTADGETRIVNKAREPDLFWALKGGGGRHVRRRHPGDACHARASPDFRRPARRPSCTLGRGLSPAPCPLYRLLCDKPLESALGRASDCAAGQPPADPNGLPGSHTG